MTDVGKYGEAIEELEQILARLESTMVDVDELTQHVRRAALLIEQCRGRLRSVESDVSDVLTELGRLGADPQDVK
ncbi:MAG: exodeoxyribonuclease VII small subunit [Actinomycetota bacterium]|nr:exodeoxyribonuclease VII small subunit [Actinomycetota bacterium]